MLILNNFIFKKMTKRTKIKIESAPSNKVWYNKLVGFEVEADYHKGEWWVNGNPLFAIPDSRIEKTVFAGKQPKVSISEFEKAVLEVEQRYGYFTYQLLKSKIKKPITTMLQKYYTNNNIEKIGDRYYRI